MSSNEPYIFCCGQVSLLVEGADFLRGYLSGYRYSQLSREQVQTDQKLYDFLAKHIVDVHHSGALNAGYIVGYVAALVELIPGDCQLHPSVLFHHMQGKEF